MRKAVEGAPVVPAPAIRNSIGYVLFEKAEDAEKAMEMANGKFLGPNQLYIQKYKTLAARMEDNKEVLIQSLPMSYSPDEVKSFVMTTVNKHIAVLKETGTDEEKT